MKNLPFTAAVAFAGLLAFHVSAAVHYVDLGSANPIPPYTNWITAATNIQDAVAVGETGDLILVTNGNYTTGGSRIPPISSSTFNRVAVTNALRVESVNGPAVTIIQGVVPGGTNLGIRCVYLANGATLAGFTVINGNVTQSLLPPGPLPDSAGGIYSESTSAVVSNCVIIGNSGYYAGGVYSGTLNACLIITNAPLFVDQAAGDFHLQSASPCINAGYNGFVTSTTDLDGNPRIAGGTVDIGACEFQLPTSLLSYAWLQQFGLPTDGSVDFADLDADGLNNWQEWRAATDPTNALLVLKMFAPGNSIAGVTLSWQSAPGRNYFLERSTNLLAQPAFQILATNITAASSTTSFTDTNAIGSVPSFYRVGVQY